MKSMHILSGLLLTVLLLCGCAHTSVDPPAAASASSASSAASQPLPAYSGPKTAVAVLPLGLSERAAKRYPHLLEKSVGLGVHNMVQESLFETRRFQFVEGNPEVVKDIMDRQWMSASGFSSNAKAVEYGKMLGAEKVIYGEVYDYAQGGETVSGFSGRQGFNVTVGIQIAYTDVTTGEKLSIGTSRASASSYGEACQLAVDQAVSQLIRRMP